MTARLPSLNGLRAFEAAARHLSFTLAGVTASQFDANSISQYFGIDVYGFNGNTGFVDASVGTTVPDGGATIVLLGLSLLGVGAVSLRKAKAL